ncbi:MAG: transporter substrate-binding domain-containing protein, partial [Deltaproteobacteria bacterium]|nr:transporter substrate-binding domain-containing protein [Deltaproteobacteria bacterium]
VREGEDELRLALNAAIQKLKEDGTLDRLLTKWEVE